uniref:Uncharacterized protein n=1 Tax=Acrobeloides nanus TaxID=290746 RepID=A0A914CR35_9BILA
MSAVFDRQEDEVMTCLAFGTQDLENDELLEIFRDPTSGSGTKQQAPGHFLEAKHMDYKSEMHDDNPSYYQVEEMNLNGVEFKKNSRAHVFLVPSQYQLSDLHIYSALHKPEMAYQYKLHEVVSETSKSTLKQEKIYDFSSGLN